MAFAARPTKILVSTPSKLPLAFTDLVIDGNLKFAKSPEEYF